MKTTIRPDRPRCALCGDPISSFLAMDNNGACSRCAPRDPRPSPNRRRFIVAAWNPSATPDGGEWQEQSAAATMSEALRKASYLDAPEGDVRITDTRTGENTTL